jgi:hypothetical protein
MRDREYWTKAFRKAGQDLAAATRRGDINVAAKRPIRAEAELSRLEQQTPTRQAPRLPLERLVNHWRRPGG